ncbi:DUF7380 domain-containing protein [Escherichia coli]|uniref:DUF7380 domain-containing protein n=1 Tax=Escherichia coli TaxID=562 RepID=UPI0010CB374D|nr:hypothetical protein [Escherichia coli]GDB54628.1 hypothetical protein HmCmsJML196_00900 [Escherichia coli]
MSEFDVFSISVDDFKKSEYASILSSPRSYSHFDMESYFVQLLSSYKLKNDVSSWRLCYLLRALFNFKFSRSGDIIGFEPKIILYPERGYRPSDYKESFSTILTCIKENSDNPYIISRVCDVLWINNRKDIDSANKAIESYSLMVNDACDTLIEKQESGDIHIFDVVDCLDRGIAISRMLIGRKKQLQGGIVDSTLRLYHVLIDSGIFTGVLRVSEILYKNNLLCPLQLAENAEKIADEHCGASYFDAVKKLFYFASELYVKNDMEEQGRRCRIKASEITLAQFEQSSSSILKAHWLRVALGEFRAIGGMNEEIKKIREELNSIRDQINDEMHFFAIPMDLSDVIAQKEHVYNQLDFSRVIKTLIARFKIVSASEIMERARSDAKKRFFLNMSETVVYDDRGRVVASRSPLDPAGDISLNDACANYLRTSNIEHQVYVCGEFEVVRQSVLARYSLNENTFDPISQQSAFVPPGYAEIFSLGFYKLWQGDYVSACYLLLPQLENSIRWILELRRKETTKIDVSLFEEATSLSQMLANYRSEMEGVFDSDHVLTMDLLFNMKGGAAIRHTMAHGRYTVNHCYQPTSVFACVFIFYLTCLPLFSVWEDKVEPYLAD